MENVKVIVYGGKRGGRKLFYLEQMLTRKTEQLKKAEEKITRLEMELAEERKEKHRWKSSAEWLVQKLKMEL